MKFLKLKYIMEFFRDRSFQIISVKNNEKRGFSQNLFGNRLGCQTSLIFLLLFSNLSCTTINTNDNNSNNKNETSYSSEFKISIPEIFHGNWSGPSMRTSGDLGFVSYNNEMILPNGEIVKLSEEEIESQKRVLVIDMNYLITDNQITQYYMNFDDMVGDYSIAVEPEKEHYLYSGNNLVYIWFNRSDYVSESQVISFSKYSDDKLFCIRIQQTNSFNGDENDYFIMNKYTRTALPHFMHSDNMEPRHLTKVQLKNYKSKKITGQLQNYRKIIDPVFIGTWVGEIKIDNENLNGLMTVKFEISNDQVLLYFNYNNSDVKKYNHNFDYFDFLGNNFVYVIAYKTENTTIIDTYNLSIINDKEISIVYSRNSHELGDNVIYFLGEGKLNKN